MEIWLDDGRVVATTSSKYRMTDYNGSVLLFDLLFSLLFIFIFFSLRLFIHT